MAEIVDAILTAILQWRVDWLEEQKTLSKPPPICRAEAKKLKIIYDNYKDYESTFVPLLMHEIWAQMFEEWSKIELELSGGVPMDVDENFTLLPANSLASRFKEKPSGNRRNQLDDNGCGSSPKQFWIGVTDYRSEGQYQCILRCQALIEPHHISSHMRIIGEGDLVKLDLAIDENPIKRGTITEREILKNDGKYVNTLSLFGYVVDVSSERVNQYTLLADCFKTRPNNRNFHAVNYQIVIAKRSLRLKLSEAMKITCLYYLKPMIRQIESVTCLIDSTLASDILNPKHITCQMTVPTIVDIRSPHYNKMQYKAIIGTNEALLRSIPKIQLIQGPPGTGKTHTLIGIIKHFYSRWRDTTKIPKILICAPSNGAIDEVVKRLYRERDFLKKCPAGRSLRLVRVGHPDQISDEAKKCSLEDLVETNANQSLATMKKEHESRIKELEKELSKCDTAITNFRFVNRLKDIPDMEAKIAKLLRELDGVKSNEELKAKREVSEASKKNIRYSIIRNADVILTTLNSCQRHPLDSIFKNDRGDLSFHCVIVDEASQCCEPELLMPLCYKISRMILIGDPMQLPATVISRYAQEFNFGRSLFERFFIHFGEYNQSSPIAMLTEQYRMHPEICHFPSKQFYDGRLISARPMTKAYPLKPYTIFDLRNSFESRNKKSSSIENQAEADLVRNLLVAVLMKAPENSQIGVITPYRGQKRLITKKISSLQADRNITVDVNTCDGFQGQEKDIIILSCVRADNSGSIGFLKSTQRMNVALTRAKHSMIICVSAKSLSKDPTWRALIDDATNRRVLQTLTQIPATENIVTMITSDEQLSTTGTLNSKRSKLVPPKVEPSIKSSYIPELIMPMDID